MRYLSILTMLCVSCSPVPVVAVELVIDQVVISAAERHKLTQCSSNGGCFIFTRTEIVDAMKKVQEETVAIAADIAVQHIQEAVETCRKGKL